MAHLIGASANLLEMMEDWNKQLQQTSFGQNKARKPENSEDGRTPRRRSDVTARRRRRA